MKKIAYKHPMILMLALILVTTLFTVGAMALTVREGSSPMENNNPSDNPITETTGSDSASTEMPSDSTDAWDSGAGTGEFGDDTSVPPVIAPGTETDNAPENSSTDTTNSAESALDNAVTDAENAVSDVVDGAEDLMTDENGGMSIVGIVIAVVVIAALAALLFAFFSKKK